MQIVRPALIISGGQTGVDRAALDEGLALGIPIAGWCPAGRRSESGPIPEHYPLRETPVPAYPMRTRLNVRDSDATLVICLGVAHGGTALTVELAGKLHRPCLVLDLEALDVATAGETLTAWLGRVQPRILNVAGPRGSESPGLDDRVRGLLRAVLAPLPAPPGLETGRPEWPPKRPLTPALFGPEL